ncbi:serine O-acetyltransferase [Kaistia dalseonensis]|uniref:Serine O-acetyltransferase n=1 Tax=Kaistia dalseonensis TaxID=410840 RepID=A0ABU0H211_9HYPH|nr:serine O-acetyltransferase [Kaistia dalseonensis]MCX5493776.1 serine O-acetyltransferase [Kaistia dalseonensis]MDQ0436340.1 serine O-acetyltransferase [Kaistia dalseonensis]
MTVQTGPGAFRRQAEPAQSIGYFGLLAEDYRSYKERLLAQGFWAIRIHRFGTMARHVRFAPLRIVLKIIHRIFSKLSQIFFGIYIGANAQVGRRCIIEHFGEIIVHSEAVIGDDVRLRQGVTIGNRSEEAPLDVPVIGNRVNIGAGAKILGPISIGDDVDIGANAVVLTDVPSGSIAVGVPARIKPKKPKQTG